MAKKEEVSKAELYRKERKERLAKEAKKNAKRNAAAAKAKKIILKVVAVIAIIALIGGITVTAVNYSGSTVFKTNVAKIGDYNISSSEFKYYYRQMYNYYSNYSAQYDQYYGTGSGKSYTGFDYTVAPDQQDFPNQAAASEENAVTYDTWHDYIVENTYNMIQSKVALATEAEKAGIELDESEKAEIDSELEEMRKTASENSYTLNAYLKISYGKGINEKLMKKFMLRDALAAKYGETKNDEIMASYTDDQITKEYETNTNDYAFTDLRMYNFEVEDPETDKDASDKEIAAAKDKAKKAAKAEADQFMKAVKDEKTFIAKAAELDKKAADEKQADTDTADTAAAEEESNSDSTLQKKADYATVEQNIGADSAKWIFDATRKKGDMKLFEVTDEEGNVTAYCATYILAPSYKDAEKRINVRHILLKFEDGATDEKKTQLKAQAETLLQEWKNGAATEDSFAELATEKSEDTGSASNGGLYEHVYNGRMVKNFNDWCFDSSRKAGDTGVVETDYGYHIMYFVGADEEEYWKVSVREALATEDFGEYSETLEKSEDYAVIKGGYLLHALEKSMLREIRSYIYNIKQSQSANQSASQSANS